MRTHTHTNPFTLCVKRFTWDFCVFLVRSLVLFIFRLTFSVWSYKMVNPSDWNQTMNVAQSQRNLWLISVEYIIVVVAVVGGGSVFVGWSPIRQSYVKYLLVLVCFFDLIGHFLIIWMPFSFHLHRKYKCISTECVLFISSQKEILFFYVYEFEKNNCATALNRFNTDRSLHWIFKWIKSKAIKDLQISKTRNSSVFFFLQTKLEIEFSFSHKNFKERERERK